MKQFVLTLFVFALLALAPTRPRAVGMDDTSIDDVQEFSVDGIDVLLRETTEAPTVSAICFIRGGTSAMSKDELPTSEYFAMALVPSSGSEITSKQQYRRKMLRMGSVMGGNDGRDFSTISMRCTRENFDATWKFFGDIFAHPVVDTTEFRNLQRNALVGVRDRSSDPDRLSHAVLDSMFFHHHPYGKHVTAESITAQTPAHVLDYYKSIVIKSRMLLVVVGNVSRKELEAKMRSSGMTSLPMGSFTPPKLPIPAQAYSPGAFFPPIDRKLPTNYVLCYHHIPNKGDSDYYAYVRLRNFLGGFLFQHLRVQTNLAYAPNNDDLDWLSAVEEISFQTNYVDSAVKIFFNDVDFFQKNLILESAIKSGVAKWTTSNYLKQETTIGQAVAIGQAQLLTGSWRNAFISFSKLSKVTPEQIQRVAKIYYRNFNWCVVGDTTGIDKSLLLSR
ncbi:MAG: insulinase family protein [Bacteroidetes bacterium]|nr:insulinase family protein [Bacteroidota bacterium]